MPYDPKADARVKKILYKPSRVKAIADHLASIDVLMNLRPDGRSNVLRGAPGSGPDWYVQATGKLSPHVIEAADRCNKIARLLLETHDELAKVDFPARDKLQLRTALAESAHAMTARARAWRAPGKIDVPTAVAQIAAHERASARAFRNVVLYLHEVKLR